MGEERSDSGGRVGASIGGLALWAGIVLVFNVTWARLGWLEARSFDGANQILAHICSFAGKQFLNSVMHTDAFDDNAGLGFVAVLILLAVCKISGLLMRFI